MSMIMMILSGLLSEHVYIHIYAPVSGQESGMVRIGGLGIVFNDSRITMAQLVQIAQPLGEVSFRPLIVPVEPPVTTRVAVQTRGWAIISHTDNCTVIEVGTDKSNDMTYNGVYM